MFVDAPNYYIAPYYFYNLVKTDALQLKSIDKYLTCSGQK